MYMIKRGPGRETKPLRGSGFVVLHTAVKQGILQITDKEGAAQVISYGDHMERTRDTGAKQSCVYPPLANFSNPKL